MREITKVVYLCYTLLILVSCSNEGLDIDKWQVLYNQSEEFQEVLVSEKWKSIELQDTIPLSYKKLGTHQYIWLKGEFNLVGQEEIKGVGFNYLSPVHRIYINNTLIAETLPEEVRDLGGPKTYFIPSGILKPGSNTVYIRVGEYDRWEIEVHRGITLESSPTFIRSRGINRLINEILPLFVLTILIVSSISFILKGVMERYNREYLILAFRLLLIVLCYLTFYSPIPIFSPNIIESIWSRVLPLFILCILLQPQIIYSIYFTRINRILLPLLLISSLINNILIIGLSLITGISYLVYIGIKILKNRRKNFKLVLTIFDSSIVILNILTIYIFLAFRIYILDPSFVVIVSCAILTLIYTIYFAKRESIRKEDIALLKTQLEELEKRSNKGNKLKISHELEAKLDSLIKFIKENHSQSVTRELLAETVGISPNYLSSLFNSYTGKKINEYINDIRLDDASIKLNSSNLTITDIAFSSGFESLTTFNRLFKKRFGSSPKKYREK